MELDKRIKALTDIQSVNDGCHDWEFMTKKGYFANSIFDFKELKRTCVYGEYDGYREHDKCFSCKVHLYGTSDSDWFTYFIPEDVLKPEEPEKKYRPLTSEELLALFDSGKLHSIRRADAKGRFVITDIYFSDSSGTEEVYVCFDCCDVGYDMDYLLENNFEYLDDHEWKPFGIEIHK